MNNPKVSVLIPSFNYANFLPEAIESVLSQTYQDFEIIVVDNSSTDNTVEVVNSYIKKDSRIKLYVNEENIGMFRNYNQALTYANGEYIKFLNADDKFKPTILEKFTNILENNKNVSIVTSKRRRFEDDNDVLDSGFSGIPDRKLILKEVFKRGNFIGEPTSVMFRKKDLNVGTFNIDLKMTADFDMWVKLIEIGDIYFVDEVLSYFRIHKGQGTKYLNDERKKQAINVYQGYMYIINKLMTNNYLDEEENNKLIKYNNNRMIRNIARNLKFVNGFKILYNFKVFLRFYFKKIY